MLLPRDGDEENYSIPDCMICSRTILDLKDDMNEEDIRAKVVLSSKKDLPFLEPNDSEFVKRDGIRELQYIYIYIWSSLPILKVMLSFRCS